MNREQMIAVLENQKETKLIENYLTTIGVIELMEKMDELILERYIRRLIEKEIMNKKFMIEVLENQNEAVLVNLRANYLTKECNIEEIKKLDYYQIQELVEILIEDELNKKGMIEILESLDEAVLVNFMGNYFSKEYIISEISSAMKDEQIQELVDNLN